MLLPVETLEEIVNLVDEPRDLFNLASACRILARIIIPRHLQYRVIRCRLNTSTVGKQLSMDKLLARNVRILELQQDPKDDRPADPRLRIPRGLEFAETYESHPLRRYDHAASLEREYDLELRLISSIKNMSNLTHFKWNRDPPLIGDRSPQGDVWMALKGCRELRELDALDVESTRRVYRNHALNNFDESQKSIWNSDVSRYFHPDPR
jgi:hypothetical protein